MESIKRNTLSLLNECSIYSKVICLGFVIFYGLSFVQDSVKYLAIIPGKLLPPNFWLWTILTFPFFEIHIWNVILNIVTVFLVEKLLLPLWRWLELIKFCVIVNIVSAVLTVITFYIVYVFTFRVSALFQTYIHGLTPLFAALTVACRQQMGDNVLFALPLGNLRNKHLPFCLVGITLALTVLKIMEVTYLLLSINGILVSWVYLRFYQKHKTGGRGDYSDDFTFAGFFPNHLEPPVAILSNTIFSLLIRLKVCKKFDRRYDLNSPTTITLNMAGIDTQDTERRKQLALKALNERLSRPDNTAQWPTIVDDSKEAENGSTMESSSPTAPLLTSTTTAKSTESMSPRKEETLVEIERAPVLSDAQNGMSEIQSPDKPS